MYKFECDENQPDRCYPCFPQENKCIQQIRTQKNTMKLADKISWLMRHVQGSLLPYLNQCFVSPALIAGLTKRNRLENLIQPGRLS